MSKKPIIDRGNPVYNFISQVGSTAEQREDPAPQRAQNPAPDPAPQTGARSPKFKERKTRRLQLIVQPSLYEKIKEQADAVGNSVNDYIHSILEEAVKGEN